MTARKGDNMSFPGVFQNDGQLVVHMINQGYSMPTCHIHNHNEMILITQGHLLIESNMDSVEVEAPVIVLHNSYALHRTEQLNDGDYERYIINFDDAALEQIPALQKTISFFKNANLTVIRLTEDMRDLLLHYIKRYPMMDAENGSINLLTCLILYEISKYRSAENTVRLKPKIPYINEIMHYISNHYKEPLTLDELTSRHYISRAKLVADFRNTTDMTVKQYITLVRMNVARALLINGASTGEAARESGYNNTSNFTSTFAKYFGVSPIKYREFYNDHKHPLD